MATYLTHARVVLPDDILEDAALLVEDGIIRAMNPVSSGAATEINLGGHIVMPGMVDLHSDALEKDVEPRPNVFFPLDFAIAQADKRNAQAGISTGFHALSFAHEELGVRNRHLAADLARTVQAHRPYGLVDNRVHCRYEITDATSLPVLQSLLQDDVMALLSCMDHTPGQGQFKELTAYRDFLTRTYAKTLDDTEALIQRKLANARGAYRRIGILVKQALQQGVQVASCLFASRPFRYTCPITVRHERAEIWKLVSGWMQIYTSLLTNKQRFPKKLLGLATRAFGPQRALVTTPSSSARTVGQPAVRWCQRACVRALGCRPSCIGRRSPLQ
jgi:hypothetical protein